MSLLRNDIAKAIFAGFKGKLLIGELRRETGSNVLDEYGDDIYTVSYTKIEGFTSRFKDHYTLSGQVPDTDLKVNIFAQSAPDLVPTKDDKVQFDNVWYQLRNVKIDPAQALWICQAFQIDPPIDAS